MCLVRFEVFTKYFPHSAQVQVFFSEAILKENRVLSEFASIVSSALCSASPAPPPPPPCISNQQQTKQRGKLPTPSIKGVNPRLEKTLSNKDMPSCLYYHSVVQIIILQVCRFMRPPSTCLVQYTDFSSLLHLSSLSWTNPLLPLPPSLWNVPKISLESVNIYVPPLAFQRDPAGFGM